MSIQRGYAIWESMVPLYHAMMAGDDLDLYLREITRRLHLLRSEIRWSPDIALVAVRLRANAAHYAMRYRPPGGSVAVDADNRARLDEVLKQAGILQAHLRQQL